MQHSQENFMRITGNDQKNNGQNFWEILERIMGIIGAGLFPFIGPYHSGFLSQGKSYYMYL